MSILTKPALIKKGYTYTFSISKTELLSHPMVDGHDYFNNSENWKEVTIQYRSVNQIETVCFHMLNGEPQSGTFKLSSFARSGFIFAALTIHDYDGGFLILKRSDFDPETQFDLDSPDSDIILSQFYLNDGRIESLYGDDSTSKIGQSFQIESEVEVGEVQVMARNIKGATGTIGAKIYNSSTHELIAISPTVFDTSSLTGSFTKFSFAFQQVLVSGSYYFIISPTEALTESVEFSGNSSNMYSGGSLFASDKWWPQYDLGFAIYRFIPL